MTGLDHDLAWGIADWNSRGDRLGRQIDHRNAVPFFIGHISGFSVVHQSDPVWHEADRNFESQRIGLRIDQAQFIGSLADDQPILTVRRKQNVMRRRTDRDLCHDVIVGGIENLYRSDPSLSEVQHFPVRAEAHRSGDLGQWHAAR